LYTFERNIRRYRLDQSSVERAFCRYRFYRFFIADLIRFLISMEKQQLGSADPPPAYGDGGDAGGHAPLYPNPHQPMPGPPPPAVVTTTVVVTPAQLPASPVTMQCPNCHAHITTEVTPTNGLLVWLCVIGLLLIGCWLGCCLIPLCVDDLKDVEHRCPQCRAYIGIKKRL